MNPRQKMNDKDIPYIRPKSPRGISPISPRNIAQFLFSRGKKNVFYLKTRALLCEIS